MFNVIRRLFERVKQLLHLPVQFAVAEKELSERLSDLQREVARQRSAISAVLRNQALATAELPFPVRLTSRRFRLLSQNEEDGLTWALLGEAGVATRRFVDIGCGAKGGNSGFLALECGWHGLMIDASSVSVEKAKRQFAVNPGVVVAEYMVTPENINDILASHGMAGEVDTLSLDIDSYGYYVWEALTACSPRIAILEYDAQFGPERAVTVPRNASVGRPKCYHGASLAALTKLSAKKGYRLILCEPTGVNAFFLRNDVAPHIPALLPAIAFRPALDRTLSEETKIDIFGECAKRNLELVDV